MGILYRANFRLGRGEERFDVFDGGGFAAGDGNQLLPLAGFAIDALAGAAVETAFQEGSFEAAASEIDGRLESATIEELYPGTAGF